MSDGETRLRGIARDFAPSSGTSGNAVTGVAVSGGSDSMAMLHLLAEEGLPLAVVTVDHGLRPESRAEAEFVRERCAALGVPHSILTWKGAEATGNLQDQARRARYALMETWAGQRGIDVIALGHTLDDQSETFLMRLARGSGIDGLCGMESRRVTQGVTWARPFLTVRRDELRGYLERRDLPWIDDPSNEDDRFDRVKARRAMACLEPLGVTPERLFDVMSNLADVRLDLDIRAKAAFDAAGEEQGGDVIFRFPAFREAALGPEVLRRSFVAALRWVSGAEYPPRAEALADLVAGLRKDETRTLHGCLATPGRAVRIAREFNAVKDLRCPTDQMWDGRWKLDGSHAPDLEIRALGEAVKDCPDWRDTGMPRTSLIASPAVWRGAELVAAPLAGLGNGWTASATGRGSFTQFLLSR
ncbi:MAG: tRNA lysidine(34) synthetase TilS [Roseovarius confluentis]|uniref:tRNA lysidine(34) synthetase TilS n=1 Tax=Roseovarius sp. TaxID=1486281 RepID=UPI0032EB8DA3